ncbi:MAG TPA: hypothetical protein VLS93_14565 [Anaeromyxobacteraceae bacterium]|nr:hypothetical protein [Anaeromyxobacteraceae bacterium]
MKRAIAAAAAAALACAIFRPVEGRPSGRAGWLAYRVGAVAFEAPEGWRAWGGPTRVTVEAPDGNARLVVSQVEDRFPDERACLAAAEEELRRGEAGLSRVRRHATTLAGRRAWTQEADQGPWHGWAFGVCDGGVQYRAFLVSRTPTPPETVEVHRALVDRIRIGGEA